MDETTHNTTAAEPVVCLYHADCFDGTGAAWVLTKRFPNAICIAVNYKDEPPYAQIPPGASLYIVDFCYGNEELMTLSSMCKELIIFDHHIGMKDTIARFNEMMAAIGWSDTHYGVFNNSVSGAKLTWLQLMGDEPVPMIVEYISDRDLWKFELEETKAVMAGLGSYPLDLAVWDRLLRWTPADDEPVEERDQHQDAIDQLESDGHVILRTHQIEIDRITKGTKRTIRLEGLDRDVTLINVPRHLASEALSLIAANEEMAMGYFDSEHYREFSLRSAPNGPDVREIAQRFGGSGHVHAAGFRIPRNHPLASI